MADRRCGFVQVVFSGIGNVSMNLLDTGSRFLPVVAEFNLAAHAPLILGQALLVFLEAVEWFEETSVTHCGEPCNADINANRGGGSWQWMDDFTPSLNRHKPFAARLADGHVFDFTQNVTAVAVP